ncbi:MAG: outer membrane lipoprotein carrier protein LolA [Sphingobacteriales bacterium]|uniref:LolA family protein n=1 Tax=Hydrotalea flava TaxID=714549 RepID=UPI00083054CA|nr:outer membrane lipoprotein carrier protein LolA [Hydrotalea flava]RTL55909.1 MAG: outer membrane lipoprotein carrier protein LolA [Sphingobacteriales bacterium]
MKYLFFVAAFLIGTSTKVKAQNDPAAKKVLNEVGEKVKSAKGITAKFMLESITSKGKPNGIKAGTLSMKGDKYLLKQGKTVIICDGINVYNYDGNKTITKSSVEESAATLSPQKLLSGSYDKDFNYKLISSNGSSYQIEMFPKDDRRSFQKVDLFINKLKRLVTKAVILDKSNNKTVVLISNMNTAAKLPDGMFNFNRANYPADAELLD